MATAFLDFVVLVCPIAFAVAAWVFCIKGLAAMDEISAVVNALIQPKGVADDVSRETSFSRPKQFGHDGTGGLRPASGSFQAHAAHGPKDINRRGSSVIGLKRYARPVRVPAFPPMALLAFLAAELIVIGSPPARAARFKFDQRRTEVRFAYRMAYSTQHGRFTKVSGTLDYDEAAPGKSKISASIAATSLNTGEALVDNELKGAAFFNIKASPVIVFKSLEVRAGAPSAAEVWGELTVNGITKPVTLNVSIEPHDDPALKYDVGARRFIARTRIRRSEFNMTEYQSMVDDDVDIEIDAVARLR